MLASFVVKSGALGGLCAKCPQRCLVAVQAAQNSSIAKRIEDWDKANAIFYGPERDYKNFPTQRQLETPPPVRLGFLPESWFQTLYPRTGVTGPYLFGVGLLGYVLSKEIWVIDHNFSEMLGFWGAIIWINYKFGDKIGNYINGLRETNYNDWFVKPVEEAKEIYQTEIQENEKAIWRAEGQKYLFEAKKENVDLQLEAAYRQRIQNVYTDVKKRLDYQVDVLNTNKQFEQEHMVNWIVSGVMKSITPQQEKESITSCLQTLKKLQATA
ncbi:ATP synthase subunit b, mitochondrial [Patella vulgata]|uniref:ATP synthase subunit b, mitochondrial n=1 Tax=Patella vulgata TaxID=6465 RepID=UPI00218041B7|nr:ATP synthase subunit b, mitochondrial [Patella vulgata]